MCEAHQRPTHQKYSNPRWNFLRYNLKSKLLTTLSEIVCEKMSMQRHWNVKKFSLCDLHWCIGACMYDVNTFVERQSRCWSWGPDRNHFSTLYFRLCNNCMFPVVDLGRNMINQCLCFCVDPPKNLKRKKCKRSKKKYFLTTRCKESSPKKR